MRFLDSMVVFLAQKWHYGAQLIPMGVHFLGAGTTGATRYVFAARERAGAYALVPVALAFLFVGFVKGALASPIDLTVVLAAATLAIAATQIRGIQSLISPMTVALAALCIWLAIRIAPDPNPWAIRKLGDIVVFGAPALLAGVVIGGDRVAMRWMMALLAWAAVPAAAFVVWQAAAGNPYSFSSIGTGGYQLTGIFFAFSFIAAAALRWHIIFAIAALGCAVSGNISGAAFGAAAVVAIWITRKDWRAAGTCAGVTFAVLAAYTVVVAPPLVFMRLIWKFGGSLLLLWDMQVTPFEAAEALSKHSAGRGVNAILSIMPAESQKYLVEYPDRSRLSQYMMAFDLFKANPIAGNGFGSINYLGSPYPHNVVLELAAEAGAVGVLLFAGVILVAFRSARRHPFALAALILVTLLALVSGYFGGRIFMFCLGLAGGSQYVASR